MSTDTTPELSPEQLAEIERKFDPETAFRPTGKMIGFLIAAILVSMSVYHFYASGFGLVRELVHRGIHLSFVLGLVFLLFGIRKSETLGPKAWHRFDGVPLIDIFFCIAGNWCCNVPPAFARSVFGATRRQSILIRCVHGLCFVIANSRGNTA